MIENRRRKPLFIAVLALFIALASAPAASQTEGGDSTREILFDRTLSTDDGLRVQYSAPWSEGPVRLGRIYELVRAPSHEVGTPSSREAPRIRVSHEPRRTHAEAVRRLQEIDAEQDEPATFLEIGGWPALQRRYRVPMERPGPPREDGVYLSLRVTTAIAAGPMLVRIEGLLWPGTSEQLVEELEAIGRSAAFESRGNREQVQREIRSLLDAPRLKHTPPAPVPAAEDEETDGSETPQGAERTASPAATTGVSEAAAQGASVGQVQRIQTGGTDSEIEIAVSTNGMNIVVVNNGRDYATSNDGGQTFPTTGVVPAVPGGGGNGDPSIAFGASGNFYFGFIGFPPIPAGSPAPPPPPANPRVCSTGIASSVDNGLNFNFVANATQCDDLNGPSCFPDQEHIAADRFALSGSGQDQLYSTWRNFSGGGCNGTGFAAAGPVIPTIVCSTNGGATWPTTQLVGGGAGDYPRITVGQDSFVYVVFRSGNNLMVDKFSSCATGLVQQAAAGFPATIAAGITRVDCATGIPGIDRCNNGSDLTSHMVAVDDTNANHVYAAYAVNTAAGVNENVLVQDSTDGGATWPAARTVQLNNAVNGRRFMPWVCSVGGAACVSWYDMRAATPAQNDLADYFGGSAFLDGGGNLTAAAEFQISTVADPLCASGWGAAPRSVADSETCSVQPQLAGVCINLAGNLTGVRCDFSNCGTAVCAAPAGAGAACECNVAAMDTCQCGGGIPKYGDYNGNACAAGRFYTAWASATSPPGILPASINIDVFFAIEKNQPPVAVCTDVTKPADASCQADVTAAEVDNGSFDPEGFPLTFSLDPSGPYPLGDTLVTLTVTDDVGDTDTCTATVTVEDVTPPVITCPADVTLTCGESTEPDNTGFATATDNCDPDPTIAFGDNVTPTTCPADPIQEVIQRTWTATDDSGNVSDPCTQNITVLKVVLEADIKPGSCPNPINTNSGGFLPVGLLGESDFDVTTVDVSTVVLSRADCVGGVVGPNDGPPGPKIVLNDVGTPFAGALCDCHTLEEDGIVDWSLHFRNRDVVSALQLDALPVGDIVEVTLSGELANSCKFIASDCIRIQSPGGGP